MSSRDPGYWLYEAVVYALARAGGFVATNLAAAAAGAIVFWMLLRACRALKVAHPFAITACALATPVVLIACSSTDDYVFSAAFLFVAAESMIANQGAMAVLAGFLAIGFRPSNAVVLAGMYLGLLLALYLRDRRDPRLKNLALYGLVTAFLGGLWAIPSYLALGHSFAFLTPGMGQSYLWTWKMQLGRLVLKPLYLFGPLASLFLASQLWRTRTRQLRGDLSPPQELWIAVLSGGVIANLLLFARFPIEIEYLLPACLFFLPLAGWAILRERRAILAFAALLTFSDFVTLSLARPNVPNHASDATIRLAVKKGFLLEDLATRWRLRSCRSENCYVRHAPPSTPY